MPWLLSPCAACADGRRPSTAAFLSAVVCSGYNNARCSTWNILGLNRVRSAMPKPNLRQELKRAGGTRLAINTAPCRVASHARRSYTHEPTRRGPPILAKVPGLSSTPLEPLSAQAPRRRLLSSAHARLNIAGSFPLRRSLESLERQQQPSLLSGKAVTQPRDGANSRYATRSS